MGREIYAHFQWRMAVRTSAGVKIDGELEKLMESPDSDMKEPFPVVVRCDENSFDQIVGRLTDAGHGELRVIRPLASIAAVLPLGDIKSITETAGVTAVELDRRLSIL